MTVFSRILKIAGSLLGVALLSGLGGLIGAYLGGNCWANFTLFGVRGYEAAGLVGMVIGLASGVFIFWWLSSRWN